MAARKATVAGVANTVLQELKKGNDWDYSAFILGYANIC